MTRRLTDAIRGFLQWRPAIDGRAVLICVVAVYLSAIAGFRQLSDSNAWRFPGVPPGPSLFFDARNLTAAWECQRLGYDPLYENPCDPWRRPLMYLRPWLVFGFLGLDQSDTSAVAWVLIAAMFLSFALLAGRVPAGTGLMLACAACSPAVMLAVERANVDVALFSLIVAAVLLWRAAPGPARVLSPIVVLLGATAKIYPVFALGAFLFTRNRIAVRTALVCAAAFAVYIAWNFRDVSHVAEIATQGQLFSYGARILPAHLYHWMGADRWTGPAALKQVLAALPLGIIAAAIIVRAHRRLRLHAEQPTGTAASLLGFHAGALIYLGTFMTANNFDYRLVFLLLTLPQLIEWASSPTHRLFSLAQTTLLAIVVLLWIGSLSDWLNLWDELASWAVAALLTTVIAATVPILESVRTSLVGRTPFAGPDR